MNGLQGNFPAAQGRFKEGSRKVQGRFKNPMRWGDAAPPDPPALSTSAVPREPPKQVLRKIQGDFPLKTEKMPNWNFFKGKCVAFKGISRGVPLKQPIG